MPDIGTEGRWVPQEQHSRKGPGNASNISSAQASTVPGSQRANRILGCSKHSTAIQLKDVNVPIFLAPFWTLCAVLVSTVWQACWSIQRTQAGWHVLWSDLEDTWAIWFKEKEAERPHHCSVQFLRRGRGVGDTRALFSSSLQWLMIGRKAMAQSCTRRGSGSALWKIYKVKQWNRLAREMVGAQLTVCKRQLDSALINVL